MIPVKINSINETHLQKALKAVLNILEKWQCSTEEMQRLLGLKRSTLFKYKSLPEKASISQDLMERLSYLLNIHAALRVLFSHPDSVYNWIRKPNQAPFFNGKSAMDIMLQGRVVDLWAVASRLNAERGGKA
ncbi:MbcA/ParS/Xre antitoxin family protein [Legionella fairfieldensis]|uniref:MbcA/ParS/Xre antitoxin family protein n=1 Tax=Legionella fairfieldensis TaxID=45064 RepID=UPI000683E342|nr:MbcA/ParS/Xre antitoxin family protein [Legionella fairfieldensis]